MDTLQEQFNTEEQQEETLQQPSILYADDTGLIVNLDNPEKSQRQLHIFSKWADESNAEWNFKKCWIVLEANETIPPLYL